MKYTQWINIIVASSLLIGLSACGDGNGSTEKQVNEEKKTNINSADLVAGFFFLNDKDMKDAGKDAVHGPTLTVNQNDKTNTAYAFDGVDDVIEIPHSEKLVFDKTITLAAWVSPKQQRSAVILRKGAEVNGDTAAPYELGISATGDAIFSLRIVENGTPTWEQLRYPGYTIDDWFHIAGTYDGTTMKLYIDGNLEKVKNITGSMPTNNTSPLLIGSRLKTATSTWLGSIADVRIHDKALSSDDIAKLAGK